MTTEQELLQIAIEQCDCCMDITQVEPEDAAAWQIVRAALTKQAESAPAGADTVSGGADKEVRYLLNNALPVLKEHYPSLAVEVAAFLTAPQSLPALTDEQIELAQNFRAAFDTPIARRKLDGGEAGKFCRQHFRAILAAAGAAPGSKEGV